MAKANAAVAPKEARIAAMIAGPSVKLISIATASSANAVRRSSSESKRWRQIVRVSVVIGEANAPASPANTAMAAKGRW